jgi:hypothetical protein
MDERNPAILLYDIFADWSHRLQQGLGASVARGWDDDADQATLEHIEAWRYLGDIERTIVGLTDLNIDMTASASYLPRWGEMAASVGVAWSSNTGMGSAFPADAMAQLRALGTIIQLAGGQARPTNLNILRDVVDKTIELLGEDDSLTGELRAYLVKLVREIRDALDDEVVGGGFDFTDAAERLWVAMHAASAQSSSRADVWKEQAARMLPPAVGGVLTHVGVVGFDHVMKALGVG